MQTKKEHMLMYAHTHLFAKTNTLGASTNNTLLNLNNSVRAADPFSEKATRAARGANFVIPLLVSDSSTRKVMNII